jgi:hypothetical protein
LNAIYHGCIFGPIRTTTGTALRNEREHNTCQT